MPLIGVLWLLRLLGLFVVVDAIVWLVATFLQARFRCPHCGDPWRRNAETWVPPVAQPLGSPLTPLGPLIKPKQRGHESERRRHEPTNRLDEPGQRRHEPTNRRDERGQRRNEPEKRRDEPEKRRDEPEKRPNEPD